MAFLSRPLHKFYQTLQEAAAKREAERVDQEAKGRLERQRIVDEAEAEKARRALLSLQAESAAVESTGRIFAKVKLFLSGQEPLRLGRF